MNLATKKSNNVIGSDNKVLKLMDARNKHVLCAFCHFVSSRVMAEIIKAERSCVFLIGWFYGQSHFVSNSIKNASTGDKRIGSLFNDSSKCTIQIEAKKGFARTLDIMLAKMLI